MRGFLAVLRKEFLHMRRDRSTLFFAILVPVFELILFGLIDSEVRRVPTVVHDASRTQESRLLIEQFGSTGTYAVTEYAPNREAARAAVVEGRVKVALDIPADYAARRLRGLPAQVEVLVDGSDSTVASQALAAANGIALRASLNELLVKSGTTALPIDLRPKLLFNPDGRSAVLLIPGLIAIILTFSGTMLTAFAVVRERERGTLEQLLVTPVSPVAVMLGKLIPYLGLGYFQLCLVLFLMRFMFSVPIHGSLPLLMFLSLFYLFALMALGLLVSSGAQSQLEASQKAMSFMLPSIFLSGYIFPIASLPRPLQLLSPLFPATHYIAIARGIVIRGAGFADLWPHAAALAAIATVLVAVSAKAFRKTIA